MTVVVFSPTYAQTGRIESFIDFQWQEDFHGEGGVDITVEDTETLAGILTRGSFLYRPDRGTSMVIVSVIRDTEVGTIQVGGYSTLHLLSKRIISSEYNCTGTAETDIQALISSNKRELSVHLWGSHGYTATHTATVAVGDNLLDDVLTIAQSADIGIRVTEEPVGDGLHSIDVYTGTDRSYVSGVGGTVFSQEFGNLASLNVKDDGDVYKNVCYVSGSYNDTDILVTVGSSTGDNRYETYLSGSSAEDGETEAAYRARLAEEGETELLSYLATLTFETVVDSSRLGTDFDLGDIVTCVSSRYGYQYSCRIESITDSISDGSLVTTLTLGNPGYTQIRREILKNG